MKKCDFSSKHYMEILNLLKNNGYNFLFYKNYRNNSQTNGQLVILRHDIDQSIDAAYHIAQIENNLAVKSTYFVWITSPFYNILDPSQTKLLLNILDLGHDIGLHFDPTAYPESNDIVEKLQIEIEILAKILNHNISSFSFHRPGKNLLNKSLKIKGLFNAYDKTFFKEFKYISDSNHNWSEDCACNHIKNNKLHILTHPIWWNYNHLSTQNDKLNVFKDELNEKIIAELVKNIKGFQDPMKESVFYRNR
ncbi:hypothetical protein BGM26_17665 [Bacillus sp. FJAT-29790]|uniref:hypothetical protein n=1 Tax=Bacillus sp. FJAT-29790 TaxID=1895002 RepID=UPI001C228445|nr:hypothetical protein [Bacillus sp. FJAT-29790]MBU8880783.1 hypothetical protein [Bacillus sp. FJAT-29790]